MFGNWFYRKTDKWPAVHVKNGLPIWCEFVGLACPYPVVLKEAIYRCQDSCKYSKEKWVG